MTRTLPFTSDDWQRIFADYSAWWDADLDRPLVYIQTAAKPHESQRLRQTFRHVDRGNEEIVDLVEAEMSRRKWHADGFPHWFIDFGPGIAAAFLGGDVRFDEQTAWFEPAETVGDLSQLHVARDEDNPWWVRIRELTRTAVDRLAGRVAVSHTDLGGNLDILASLRTTELLLTDLLDAPEEVDRLVGEVTRAWLSYYDELDAIIRPACGATTPWAPILHRGRCYMLQCDFAYMISPEMFERFVLPDLQACCDALDGGFYHLDGVGQIPHLEFLLRMERLRGIQWVPGDGKPPVEEWPDVLGRIKAAGKRCQLYVTPAGALKIVREHGGRGFLLAVGGLRDDEEVDEFLAALRREDAER